MASGSLGGGRRGDVPALTRIRKRDGREAPYDGRKVEAAVLKATAAVGEPDEPYAREVAGLVEMSMVGEQRARGAADATGEHIPTIEEIQDLVERALVETGRSAVAKAYILYRDKRARVREAVRIEPAESLTDVRVRDAGGTSSWSKGRIVAALMTEAELSRSSAAEIASAVETKVFGSGLTRITTGLIRELVDIELASRGWTAALARQEPVSLPRHDLRRALAGLPFHAWEEDGWRPEAGELAGAALDPESGDGIAEPVSREVLTRFSVREVLDEPIAEMHLAGDLHIEDLGAPHLPLTISVPSELVARGEPTPGAAFALLDELATLAGECTRGIVLEDPGSALQPLARGTRAKSPLGLSAWLRSAVAVARGARRRIDLGSPGERFSSFTARLVEELDALDAGDYTPRLFLSAEECLALVRDSAGIADAVRRLTDQGRIVLTWNGLGEEFAAPGCRRVGHEQGALAALGAVAINLPRVARRAGPWREDVVFELLSGSIQCALAACRALESARSSWRRRSRLRTRGTFSIVPVGLREALRFLGDGEIDPGQGARLVGFLDEAARRFASEVGLSAVVSPFFGERASRRFAYSDQSLAQRRGQGELFGAGGTGLERPYGTGFRISPVHGRDAGEAEAELVTTLTSGALFPPPAPDYSPGREVIDRLEAGDTNAPWETWARFRLRHESTDPGLLFPHPPSPSNAESEDAEPAREPGLVHE